MRAEAVVIKQQIISSRVDSGVGRSVSEDETSLCTVDILSARRKIKTFWIALFKSLEKKYSCYVLFHSVCKILNGWKLLYFINPEQNPSLKYHA